MSYQKFKTGLLLFLSRLNCSCCLSTSFYSLLIIIKSQTSLLHLSPQDLMIEPSLKTQNVLAISSGEYLVQLLV